MKTTLEIPDSLFHEACRLVEGENITLNALVEQGLRRVLADRKARGTFHLRDSSFKGHGLHPDTAEASWEQVRDLIYEGRGA